MVISGDYFSLPEERLCTSSDAINYALQMARVSTLLLAGNTPANVRFTMKGFFMT